MFIVFEGIDGAGKSTAIQGVAEQLRQDGYRVELLSEIGSGVTGLASTLRRQLMAATDPRDQVGIIIAARRLAQTQVRRWLDQGAVVLQDRYVLSTVAYQGSQMLHIPPMDLVDLMFKTKKFLKPDVTLVLDVDPAAAAQRLQNRGVAKEDQFDQMRIERAQAIRETLKGSTLLTATSHDHLVIDAEQSQDQVISTAAAAVTYKLAIGQHQQRGQPNGLGRGVQGARP
jgi:dTMP kinase